MPIGCGGATVCPGDIVVADGDGVLMIPRHLADEIAKDGGPMELIEDFVLKEVLPEVPVVGLYPPTDPDTLRRFDAWKADRSAS